MKQLTNKKIGFIGGGTMATCMIEGLINSGQPEENLIVSDPNKEAREKLINKWAVKTVLDNSYVADNSDFLIFAIKPSMFANVLLGLEPILSKRTPIIISVAAGITMNLLEEWLGKEHKIVRAMPNTPAKVQSAVTGLFANELMDDESKLNVELLMQSIGTTIWLQEEDQIDSVISIAGSAPAYYFYFMEIFVEIGEKMGLTNDQSEAFVKQTILGSAMLAKKSECSLTQLREDVTSPGGTTAAALEILMSGDLKDILCAATKSAKAKARQMSLDLVKK